MPINGPVGPSGVTGVSGTTSSAGALFCAALAKNPTLAKLAVGAVPPIVKGAPKSETVKTLQLALFSLGHLKERTGIDGDFGPKTQAAVKAFQAAKGLAQSGAIDANTLSALDKASSQQIATLKAKSLPDGSRRNNFHIVADISDPAKTRLYVVGKNDEVQARYLTSPGTAQYPTQGDRFKISDVLVRQPWNPPRSAWAANAKPIPPGLDNPMGILKLSLGRYSEYIHGIPAGEEAELGHAASHGCLRVSGSNVLELFEKYAEAGTDVQVIRDRATSQRLAAKATSSNVTDTPTDSGREYLFGYVSGELGKTTHYSGPNS